PVAAHRARDAWEPSASRGSSSQPVEAVSQGRSTPACTAFVAGAGVLLPGDLTLCGDFPPPDSRQAPSGPAGSTSAPTALFPAAALAGRGDGIERHPPGCYLRRWRASDRRVDLGSGG